MIVLHAGHRQCVGMGTDLYHRSSHGLSAMGNPQLMAF
jgi:hypothetical protein